MRLIVAALFVLTPGAAAAQCDEHGAARVEVAPWLSHGVGVRRDRDGSQHAIGSLAMDAGVTVPVLTTLRVGAWGSHGTTDFRSFDLAGGGRIELQSNDFNKAHSDLFKVQGRYTFLLDLGAGHRFAASDSAFYVLRIAAGFTAPNLLYHLYPSRPCTCADPREQPGICRPAAGVIAGARPFVTFARALDGAWTDVTVGIEFEATGAGWWLTAGL